MKNLASDIQYDRKQWTIDSWRSKKHIIGPHYSDLKLLEEIEKKLVGYSPLVGYNEVLRLKDYFTKACLGQVFILQAGDCAEAIIDLPEKKVQSTCDLFGQMIEMLQPALNVPIVPVGRIAGQFAKSRTDQYEIKNGIKLPSYQGDAVNTIEFKSDKRQADPNRLILSYNYARQILNDLHQNIGSHSLFQQTGFYTSHEAFLLPYEQSLARKIPETDQYYTSSAHMVWLGERTRYYESAHIEFLRGIQNPLGIKCGPTMTINDFLSLIEIFNPGNIPGRLMAIIRMGSKEIKEKLPPLLKAARHHNLHILWSCDPMHGNTVYSSHGYKTRNFQHILNELKDFVSIVQGEGNYVGGIHLELTAENVTECLGGAQNIKENDLSKNYKSYCDPRLNKSQALQLISDFSKFL
ncbi:MAG: 3-deoxy-7-phosphoheptulonate synthase [Alphaproteobacteria bacterium]|nr:3-deoxy-7-phosphoheptulonate synthase [Alphaproteobacteria bacterium]